MGQAGLSRCPVPGRRRKTSHLCRCVQSLLALAAEQGQCREEIGHHFWLRLRIHSPLGQLTFPWYDRLVDMNQLFDWLSAAAEGDQFHDLDQGWEMIILRRVDRVHFREGGFDEGGEQINLSVPRAPLLSSVTQTRDEAAVLVALLTGAIGADYWS